MKKIILLILTIISFAAANKIQLTGEYSNQLGNPFRKLLNEGNTQTISIYSENKDVVLPVTSNLDNSSAFNRLQHPTKFVLNNKSVENVVEDYYIEEFKVEHKKGGITVNVISGNIDLTYVNVDDNQHITHLSKVEVTLVVEITKNGQTTKKSITMDNTLGRTGDNYDFTIRTTLDFSIKYIDKIIKEIIENSIYNNLK